MHNQFRALAVIFALLLMLSGNLALSESVLAQDGSETLPEAAENADPYANDFSHAQAKKLLEAIRGILADAARGLHQGDPGFFLPGPRGFRSRWG